MSISSINGSKDISLFNDIDKDWANLQNGGIDSNHRVNLTSGDVDGIEENENVHTDDADSYTFKGTVDGFKDLPPGTDLNRIMVRVNGKSYPLENTPGAKLNADGTFSITLSKEQTGGPITSIGLQLYRGSKLSMSFSDLKLTENGGPTPALPDFNGAEKALANLPAYKQLINNANAQMAPFEKEFQVAHAQYLADMKAFNSATTPDAKHAAWVKITGDVSNERAPYFKMFSIRMDLSSAVEKQLGLDIKDPNSAASAIFSKYNISNPEEYYAGMVDDMLLGKTPDPKEDTIPDQTQASASEANSSQELTLIQG